MDWELSTFQIISAVSNPGFPKGAAPTYCEINFSWKLHENEEILDQRLDPPMICIQKSCFQTRPATLACQDIWAKILTDYLTMVIGEQKKLLKLWLRKMPDIVLGIDSLKDKSSNGCYTFLVCLTFIIYKKFIIWQEIKRGKRNTDQIKGTGLLPYFGTVKHN